MTIDASLIRHAAAAAAQAQLYPPASLYVVATPIGNLADLTLRAIHVLGLVDAVACEDTRVSATLLRHLGLTKPLLAVHEHNEREAAQAVLERLARGERVAYVSDAGTPSLSDPGAALVAAAQAAGWRTVPLPGASAAMAALSVAGTPTRLGFRFVGFVGARAQARTADVERLSSDPAALVVFEAPHRIVALAQTLAHACPQRVVTLCRELTKQFECVVTQRAGDLPDWLAADPNRRRGEFVLVLHELPSVASDDAAATRHTLELLLREMPLKRAVALAAELTGAPRNALYEQALALRGDDDAQRG